MPRRSLDRSGGFVFHVLNRAVRRARIFSDPTDFVGFEGGLAEGLHRIPTRLLVYCIMPTHWHLVLWPLSDEMPRFMHWVTLTHAKRWHRSHESASTGPLYQNRYKAIPVQGDRHLFTALRYVERNPVRGGLVSRAEEWRWSSVCQRLNRTNDIQLSAWPISIPDNWVSLVNEPLTAGELEAVRTAVTRGWPLGEATWRDATATRLHMTLRRRGRPTTK